MMMSDNDNGANDDSNNNDKKIRRRRNGDNEEEEDVEGERKRKREKRFNKEEDSSNNQGRCEAIKRLQLIAIGWACDRLLMPLNGPSRSLIGISERAKICETYGDSKHLFELTARR